MVSFIVGTVFIAIITIGIPAFLSRHSHNWKTIDKIPKEYIIRDNDGHILRREHSRIYVQQCEQCGKLRHYVVK